MKLTKAQLKNHKLAEEILKKENLNYDEKVFVLDNWNEGTDHDIQTTGSFFTPSGFARDFRLEIGYDNVLDMCAGIGALSFYYYEFNSGVHNNNTKPPEITCIEMNPRFVEIGKKILPQANWLCGDIFELYKTLDKFEWVYSNPPFGKIKTPYKSPNYTGNEFEYKIIDMANMLAIYGASFIVPQSSAPFKFSGNARGFENIKNEKYLKFNKETGIVLDGGVGIDCSLYTKDWKNTNILTEVVTIVRD